MKSKKKSVAAAAISALLALAGPVWSQDTGGSTARQGRKIHRRLASGKKATKRRRHRHRQGRRTTTTPPPK